MDKATASINEIMGLIDQWSARCIKLQEANDPELKEMNSRMLLLDDKANG